MWNGRKRKWTKNDVIRSLHCAAENMWWTYALRAQTHHMCEGSISFYYVMMLIKCAIDINCCENENVSQRIELIIKVFVNATARTSTRYHLWSFAFVVVSMATATTKDANNDSIKVCSAEAVTAHPFALWSDARLGSTSAQRKHKMHSLHLCTFVQSLMTVPLSLHK